MAEFTKKAGSSAGSSFGESAAKEIVSYVGSRLDNWAEARNSYENAGRSLELVIVNGTKNTLTYVDAYFAHGAIHKGPKPLDIAPGKTSVAVVKNSTSWEPWVAGSFKYKIEGTNYSLYMAFTNPFSGSFKHFIAVETDDLDTSYGYKMCKDDSPKQDCENGFYVRCLKDDPKRTSNALIPSYNSLFVYTINPMDDPKENEELFEEGRDAIHVEEEEGTKATKSTKITKRTKDEEKQKKHCCSICNFNFNY